MYQQIKLIDHNGSRLTVDYTIKDGYTTCGKRTALGSQQYSSIPENVLTLPSTSKLVGVSRRRDFTEVLTKFPIYTVEIKKYRNLEKYRIFMTP
jgi:hypothetical protein